MVRIDSEKLKVSEIKNKLKNVSGILIPGGFGKRGTEGKIEAIRYARINKIPFLGICYGMQMAVVEFARNVVGLDGANSTEIELNCAYPVIDELPDQKEIEGLGGTMRLGGQDVQITEGSFAAQLFGATHARERFRHRYEVEPKFIEQLTEAGIIFSGRHPEHEIMQVLELPTDIHPYFIAGQFHPELTSRPLRPQPMFMGLVAAAIAHREGGNQPNHIDARWLASKATPSTV